MHDYYAYVPHKRGAWDLTMVDSVKVDDDVYDVCNAHDESWQVAARH
jgi:hypothetical protein